MPAPARGLETGTKPSGALCRHIVQNLTIDSRFHSRSDAQSIYAGGHVMGLVGLLLAFACAFFSGPAHASVIEAHFSGTVFSQTAGTFSYQGQSYPYSALNGKADSLTLIFDTADGSFTTNGAIHQYDGPIISATFQIEDFGTYGAGIGVPTIFRWDGNDFSDYGLHISDGFLFIFNTGNLLGGSGFFQLGPCPGRPCGYAGLQLDSVEGFVPVPISAVGAGVPGAALALYLLLINRRRLRRGPAPLPQP